MKLLVLTLLFTIVTKAYSFECFDQGHPGKIVNGKCRASLYQTQCPESNKTKCNSNLFGPNLCILKTAKNFLKQCKNRSLEENKKRFNNRPRYEFDYFKHQIKEIERICTSDKAQDLLSSGCAELLMTARELSDYHDRKTVIAESSQVYGPRCETDTLGKDPLGFTWIDQFVSNTKVNSDTQFEAPMIIEANLKVNPKGDYCVRKKEMIDTIVLHHTETSNIDSLESINQFHMSRGWYKTGYHYVLRANYKNGGSVFNTLYQTRNPLLIGAHAGSNSYSKTKPTQKEIDDIACFMTNGEYKERGDDLVNSSGEIKINATSIAIAVLGNFSPRSVFNPSGYKPAHKRLLSSESIEQLAKLLCHLKDKYPNLQYIKKHRDYKQTSCPGTIGEGFTMTKILDKTKEIGCDFSL